MFFFFLAYLYCFVSTRSTKWARYSTNSTVLIVVFSYNKVLRFKKIHIYFDAIFFLVLQASSFGVDIKDPAAWGIAARNRPGGDPLVSALAAATMACSRMLQDGEGRRCKGNVNVNGSLGSAAPQSVLPSQV